MNRTEIPIMLSALLVSFLLQGCSAAQGDCEKIRAELEQTKSRLAATKVELEKAVAELKMTRGALNQARAEFKEVKEEILALKVDAKNKERLFESKRNQFKGTIDDCRKRKSLLEAELAGARHEVVFLRQKMDELLQGLERVSGELDITRNANMALREEIQRLTRENLRLRETLGRSGPNRLLPKTQQ
ncbi:MAG: hypothetical protein JRH06_10575 [Deltaproteobacteria bacterium]|nr:hypothetical protein [Deltaproteobacteria bacterium]MBW2137989.1 hypothetical protein [Deltaproteobacteria bacterium]